MEKGVIKTDNIKETQAFSWLRELFIKAKEDSLNIKNEEWIAVEQLINKLEFDYNKYKIFFDFVKPSMTMKQLRDYTEHLENL